MKVLIALPAQHPTFPSMDDVLEGKVGCSGSNGSAIRLAGLLADAGLDVCLGTVSPTQSSKFSWIEQQAVNSAEFDRLIVHHTHWNGSQLTFGNAAIPKTILWAQNHVSPASVHTFLQEGGQYMVCLSAYHANIYRAVPQWRKKVAAIPNASCPVFEPTTAQAPLSRPQLLFIGALTWSKGFAALTKLWTYLVNHNVDLDLAIAGSRTLHGTSADTKLGPLGLAEYELETQYILPWLDSLPAQYQPKFLGSVSPLQLRDELAKSWAAIVNPSSKVPETFCNAAVEAQACGRTVFSLDCGALKETVYRKQFNSLAQGNSVEALGDRILEGLANPAAVAENGRQASEFVKRKYSSAVVRDTWLKLLSGCDLGSSLPTGWADSKDMLYDLMRWSGTGILINQYRNPEYRQVLQAYNSQKQQRQKELSR
jgi:glycosyltransferase involved in cell wall biosynthesis